MQIFVQSRQNQHKLSILKNIVETYKDQRKWQNYLASTRIVEMDDY